MVLIHVSNEQNRRQWSRRDRRKQLLLQRWKGLQSRQRGMLPVPRPVLVPTYLRLVPLHEKAVSREAWSEEECLLEIKSPQSRPQAILRTAIYSSNHIKFHYRQYLRLCHLALPFSNAQTWRMVLRSSLPTLPSPLSLNTHDLATAHHSRHECCLSDHLGRHTLLLISLASPTLKFLRQSLT